MFGYIKPKIAELKVKEHELYKALYCGLCRTQRKHTGKLSALFLSYDFVFLYLLRAELTGQTTTFKTRRRSLRHSDRQSVAEMNGQLVYCARSAALLDYFKIKDDLSDEGFFKKLGVLFLLPIASHGKKKALKKERLPQEELRAHLKRQQEVEKGACASPDRAAEASGEIFALFASFGIEDDLRAFAAEKMGRAIGRWLYLIDAADDLEKDRKKKRYNPFLLTELRREDLLCTLDALCEEAELALRALPCFDPGYRALLLNILTQGLHEQALSVLQMK